MRDNRKLIERALTDEGFADMVRQINVKTAVGRENVHHYFDNDYLRIIIEQEIEEIAHEKRKENRSGIPDLKFEMFLAGAYNELNHENPSLQRCEQLKDTVLNWKMLGSKDRRNRFVKSIVKRTKKR